MKAIDVIAPSSTQTILADVEQYLNQKGLLGSNMFEHYDDALRAVWPHIHVVNPHASIFLAINIFLECAEKRGFDVKPDFLKQAKRDGYF